MNVNLSQLIDLMLSAGLRRWRLIFYPLALFSALSVIALFYWPRGYTTHTLIMLQEREVANPLSSGGAVSREGRLRADEIDALLKSERVLANAVLDMLAGQKPLTEKQLDAEVRDLRKALTVRVVGSEFIQIDLRDSQANGLGERLSIIMTRFFERLLSRQESVKTARQFSLEQRKRDVDTAKRAFDDWISRNNASPTGSGGTSKDQAAAAVADAQLKLAMSRQRLVDSAAGLFAGLVDPELIAQAVASERRIQQVNVKTGADAPNSDSQRSLALDDLDIQISAFRVASSELSQSIAAAQMGREAGAAVNAEEQERLRLSARLAEAVALADFNIKSGRENRPDRVRPRWVSSRRKRFGSSMSRGTRSPPQHRY